MAFRVRQNGAADPERLCGAVERVTFHSEESGFCVLRVQPQGRREQVTVVGNAPSVAEGEYLEAEGRWVSDRTHGLQFKAEHLRLVAPRTLEGIRKYLSSGMVKGIGPHFAEKLVRAFGESVFEVIEHEPARLLDLEGIGPKRQARVIRAWAEQKAVRQIMVFLQSHGVGTAKAVRIYKTYGDAAIERVREDPYCLSLDIRGIGFRSADAIALQMGVEKDSPKRAQAGVRHVLQELSLEGHCAAFRDRLVDTASRLLETPSNVVDRAIAAEIEARNLVLEEIDGRPAVFLRSLHRAECAVAECLGQLLKGFPPWGTVDPASAVPWVERETGLALSDSQRNAVQIVLGGKVAVITGGPGVGKTTVVNSILQIVRAKGARVLLCAPTGRAAKRLSESTGMEAKTIHRLLEFDPSVFGFRHNESEPLDGDMIVVDEASMIDLPLMNQLLRAVPSGAALLLVGDIDQLPSVGPGTVLSDIIASEQVPTVRLVEIFRQAAGSKIIVNAHRINRGLPPEPPADPAAASDFYFIPCSDPEEIARKLLRLVTERIPARFDLDPLRDIQVLTPMHRGGVGSVALNIALQERLNPDSEPRVSRFGCTYAPRDKVMQTVNNYDKEVFNGDIGCIADMDVEEQRLIVDYDGRRVGYEFGELDEITLAYAVTIHKSQGSEYPAVVIPLATQHYNLLQRNLLYTAVTRGKRLVVVLGQPRALEKAVGNPGSSRRLTGLARRLRRVVQSAAELASMAVSPRNLSGHSGRAGRRGGAGE